ncbi:MAG: hypothetical protein ACJ744_01835 [Gaiellaceae bacterium]
MELEALIEQPRGRGRAGAALGIASALLLVSALRWAHHWGLQADVIVAAWAGATIGALGVSIWSLATSRAARRLANLGLVLAVLSLAALAIAGLAFAAGMDPTGACGGG